MAYWFFFLVPLSAASIAISFLDLTYTSWRLERLDRRAKSLDDVGVGSCAVASSFVVWRAVSAAAQVVSLAALAIVLYVEAFSAELAGLQIGRIIPIPLYI